MQHAVHSAAVEKLNQELLCSVQCIAYNCSAVKCALKCKQVLCNKCSAAVEKLNQELLSAVKVLPQSQASSRLYKIAQNKAYFRI